MKVKIGAGFRNEFTIKVEDINTHEVKEYKAYNHILDQMFSRLVNFQSYFTHIHFGTGTGTFDDDTRTSLYTFLNQKAATTEVEFKELPTLHWTRRIVLAPEEFVGANITEVGIAYGTSASSLCTHAAIQDAEGNPISLVKTETQVVTIYATVYMTLKGDDAYNDKIRLVEPLSNNQWVSYLFGATYPTQQYRATRAPEFSDGTAPGSHGQSANILVADWVKDAVNKKATTPVRRLGVSDGNGEVRGFGLGSSDVLGTLRGHFPIAGVFTGKAITETIGSGDGVKTGFNLSWNDPAGLAIEVDGVPVDSGDYDALPVKKGTNLYLLRTVQILSDPLGYPVTPNAFTDDNLETTSYFITGAKIGIDAGLSVPANKVRINMTHNATSRNIEVRGSNNADFSDSVFLGSLTSYLIGWNEISFSPSVFRYFTVEAVSQGSVHSCRQIQLLTSSDQITFHTPPASGTITADYTVNYVPKDEFHVLDLQATIQYGEIV